MLVTAVAATVVIARPASAQSISDDENVNANANCDACTFDEAHDAPNCKVYGELMAGAGLIGWELAPPTCLNYYNIHVQSFDHDILQTVWTEGVLNHDPVPTLEGLEILLHWLEKGFYNDDSNWREQKVVRQIQLDFLSKFFTEQTPGMGFEGPVVFHDRVQLGDTYFDCTENDNRDCWTALREYLSEPELDGGADNGGGPSTTLHAMGQTLEQWRRQDKELEQQSVRMQLCSDVNNAASESICGALVPQVELQWRGNTSLDCNTFGKGPPNGGGQHMTPTGKTCHLDAGGGQRVLPSGSTAHSAATLLRDMEKLAWKMAVMACVGHLVLLL